MARSPNVIDISEWQDPNTFDYSAAKAAGIKAVIIRLSTGMRADKAAAQHIANCDKYGLIWHGYHYWYNQDGEAAFAVKNAQQLGLASTKRFFLDMEDKSLDADWASQFEGFRQAVGSSFKPGLYCSDYPFKQHFNLDTLKSEGVYLWIASYSYEPANYDIWQVSGAGGGGFGSYTGDVDRDTDKSGELIEDQTPQPPDIPTGEIYRQIAMESGYDTDTGIYGKGYSPDNGKTFYVTDTTFGRRYRQEDADRIWPYLQSKLGTGGSGGSTTNSQTVTWDAVQNKPDVALKSDLTWDNLQNKPTLLKGDPGLPGKDGQAATVTVGRVTTGATVSVKNSGTATNAVLDFVLPEGSSDHSGEGTADALSVGVIAQIVRDHVSFNVNMQTGDLEMTVVDVPQTTIANQVAQAIMSKLNFTILDNGDLQVTTGGD